MTRHDFRVTTWGHNISLARFKGGTLTAFTWSTPVVKMGDELIWKTNYGYAVGQVIECKNYLDPMDMSRVIVKIIERHLSDEVEAMVYSGEVEPPDWFDSELGV